jgi:hypothetical protein
MIRRIVMRSIIIAIAVLILIGVILSIWMLRAENQSKAFEVGLDTAISPIEFGAMKLVPGDSTEYDLAFKGRRTKVYDVKLDFIDADEDGTLKNFIRVKILSGEREIYDGLMAELIDTELDAIRINFRKNENTSLKIVYYMPLEVGNEAKLATADFKLQITSTVDK